MDSIILPHLATRKFEQALCDYTGAQFAVTTSSCTMAILLAVAWCLRDRRAWSLAGEPMKVTGDAEFKQCIEIPKRTYVGVPMSILHAGGRPTFRDEDWRGAYQLKPLPVWDSARWFSAGMYSGDGAQFVPAPLPFAHRGKGQFVCLSFHASKTLGDSQGGAILHDSPEADAWLRRARFDGRAEGVAPKDDTFAFAGWHCYLSPDVAARLLWKLSSLPRHNEPLENDAYPDLSTMECFR